MGSAIFTGSVTSTSTDFNISNNLYPANRAPYTEVYLTVSSTVSVAVQQPMANGTYLATLDTTFTGPCSKLVTLRAGRTMRFVVNAATTDFRVEADW